MTYQSGLGDLGDARPSGLEQLYQSRYMLLLVSFGLFTDMILMRFGRIRLLELSLSNASQNISLGQVFVLFTAFSISQSFAIPLVRFILDICARLVFLLILQVKYKSMEYFQIPVNYREREEFLPFIVESFALKTGSEVLHTYVKDHLHEVRQRTDFWDKAFSLGILGTIYLLYFPESTLKVVCVDVLGMSLQNFFDVAWIITLICVIIPLFRPYFSDFRIYFHDRELREQICSASSLV